MFDKEWTLGMKTSLLAATAMVWSVISKMTRVEAKQFSRQSFLVRWLALGILAAITVKGASASVADDVEVVGALDTQYQTAVLKNDASTMDRILADDFILVTGSGKVYTKADLLAEARSGRVSYVHQEDTAQTVRVWGDTAVVTAKLWEKGTDNGKPFDYTVWFSDTYVRTSAGWRYVFGQSSLPLPKTP
jgi:ketosteroid isomerase-like protein